jgi:hypothetical protein
MPLFDLTVMVVRYSVALLAPLEVFVSNGARFVFRHLVGIDLQVCPPSDRSKDPSLHLGINPSGFHKA